MKIYLSLSLDPRVLKDNLQTYKSYFKLWKNSGGQLRWNEIFEGKYRIIIPLSKNAIQKAVEEDLQKNNATLLSYKENKAKDKYGREVKISKLLKGDLLQKYNADPLRQGGNQETNVDSEGKVVVISRHPIDVVSMSTGSTWTSCMTLAHKNYVPVTGIQNLPANSDVRQGSGAAVLTKDVNEGTIVAYVTDSTDTKTLTKPYCRIAIKPFININNPNDIILAPEEIHYGDYVAGFREAVVNWLESKFQLAGEIYKKSNKVLNDTTPYTYGKKFIDTINDLPEEEQIKWLRADIHSIKLIKNPSLKVQLAAIKINISIFKDINNPSDTMLIEVLKFNSKLYSKIKNPSKEVQLAALTLEPSFIENIKNPSEELQLAAVKQNGNCIGYLKNPSKTVQLAAIQHSGGTALKDIKQASQEIQLAAVNLDGTNIKFIDNPSEELQLAAVKQSKYAIAEIKNPSRNVQLLAVTKKPTKFYFNHIKNPIPEVVDYLKGN